ncbi:MAG: hypothetical protein KDK34_19520 [Leptospiraceae bacterium]|nr:hypothetical protein [Leptospiraceae bacterium]
MKATMIRFGNFIFRWRDTIFTLIILAAFGMMIFTDLRGIGDFRIDMALNIIGVVVLFSGQLVRIITIGYAYIKRGGLKKQIYAETVVRRGVFAHSRNPMYLGNLLIVTGAIIVFNILYYYPVLIFFYFIYASIIIAEEQFLRGKFGADYEDYLKSVPRLWPAHLSKWPESKADMTFTWKRVLKKEHGSFALITAGVLTYTAIKLHYRYGVAWNSETLIPFWIGLVLIAIFHIVCEILKRTSRLEWDPDRP